MKQQKKFSRYLWVVTVLMAIFTLCANSALAASKVFKGTSSTIVLDKLCKKESAQVELMLVFDEESDGKSSGWFFGKGTSP